MIDEYLLGMILLFILWYLEKNDLVAFDLQLDFNEKNQPSSSRDDIMVIDKSIKIIKLEYVSNSYFISLSHLLNFSSPKQCLECLA